MKITENKERNWLLVLKCVFCLDICDNVLIMLMSEHLCATLWHPHQLLDVQAGYTNGFCWQYLGTFKILSFTWCKTPSNWDHLCKRNQSDRNKGTERGLKPPNNTIDLFLCVKTTCPKWQWRGQTQTGTFSLYCKSLDDTISLWTWKDLTPDFNSAN